MTFMYNKYSIKSLVRAINVLEMINEIDKEFSLSELVKVTGINTNYLFRLLLTLQSKQFIEVDKISGKYRLGIKVFELGQTAIKHQELVNHSRPILEYLSNQSSETSGYSVFMHEFSYVVDCVESDLSVRVINTMGSCFPLHCTAIGKAQIAHLGDNELQLWIKTNKLIKYSLNTIVEPNKLKNELNKIYLQGYAIEAQEFEDGVGGIAAPVVNRDNKIIGSIGISAPMYRLSPERLEDNLIPLVKWAGKELSSKF